MKAEVLSTHTEIKKGHFVKRNDLLMLSGRQDSPPG